MPAIVAVKHRPFESSQPVRAPSVSMIRDFASHEHVGPCGRTESDNEARRDQSRLIAISERHLSGTRDATISKVHGDCRAFNDCLTAHEAGPTPPIAA